MWCGVCVCVCCVCVLCVCVPGLYIQLLLLTVTINCMQLMTVCVCVCVCVWCVMHPALSGASLEVAAAAAPARPSSVVWVQQTHFCSLRSGVTLTILCVICSKRTQREMHTEHLRFIHVSVYRPATYSTYTYVRNDTLSGNL